jgi:hypothetical protein
MPEIHQPDGSENEFLSSGTFFIIAVPFKVGGFFNLPVNQKTSLFPTHYVLPNRNQRKPNGFKNTPTNQ